MDIAHDIAHDIAPAIDLTAVAGDPSLGPMAVNAVRRRRFAVLATASATGRAHSAGVLYQLAGGQLWVSTLESSRKARNVAANARVALTVPVRRLPFGPLASVQLQATAAVVPVDDAELVRLAGSGALGRITGHGELELPGGCFLRIELPRRVPLYGLGMSIWSFARNPLDAGRIAEVTWS